MPFCASGVFFCLYLKTTVFTRFPAAFLLAGVRAGLPVPEGNEANSGTLKHATAGFCRTEQPKEVPKLF